MLKAVYFSLISKEGLEAIVKAGLSGSKISLSLNLVTNKAANTIKGKGDYIIGLTSVKTFRITLRQGAVDLIV